MDRLVDSRWSVSGASNPGDREYVSLPEIIAFFRQYLRFIAGCIAVSVLGAIFFNVTTDKIYAARTQILIEPKLPQLLQPQTGEVNLSLDTAQVESQIAVMQSEKIAAMVIDDLKLRDDAEFNKSPSPSLTGRVRRLLSMLANSGEGGEGERDTLSEFERTRRTMGIFREGLDIRRMGVSYAIEISFRSANAETAAQIANATANAFVREQRETKAASAREGGAWLEKRLQELRIQMNLATQEAQEFRSRHDYSIAAPLDPIGQSSDAEADNLETMPSHETTLEELEVTADTYRKIYESFLQAYTSSVSQQSYPTADARVITTATTPLYPSAPRPKLMLAFGVLAGTMLGVGLAFLRHTLDRTVRSVRQIRDELGVECLGALPPLSARKRRGEFLDEIDQYPHSRFSQGLRSIRTAISLSDTAQPVRTLGVVPAVSGPDKSAFAANLASLYAAFGLKVLLIDADNKYASLVPPSSLASNPRDTNMRVAPNTKSRLEPAGKSIHRAVHRAFDLLPSTTVISKDLFDPQRMQGFLSEIAAYDIVIVDLPAPLMAMHRLSASAVLDGVILVTEWGQTSIGALADLVRSMHASKVRIIGALLTNARSQ